jgi:hypothetical protein
MTNYKEDGLLTFFGFRHSDLICHSSFELRHFEEFLQKALNVGGIL